MRQTALDFSAAPDFARENFLVSPANEEALRWVENWPDWPAHALLVYGPKASGKTHLAHLWAARASAVFLPLSRLTAAALPDLLGTHKAAVIEDLETAKDETALFHLFNQLREQSGHLLVTSLHPPAQMTWTLPDLASRLSSVPAIAIQSPDETLLASLLLKLFADRQLRVAPDVVDYLVLRMDRSFAAAQAIVARLDQEALRQKKNITIPFAREILDSAI